MPPEIINSRRRWLSVIIDQLFALLVVAPLVVAFWRGVWGLEDEYIYPENQGLSHWISIIIGNSGLFLSSVLQEVLRRPYDSTHNKYLKTLFMWIYIYISGFFSITQWRGLWGGLDHYFGKTAESFTYSIIGGQVVLWLFRCSKNNASTPTVVGVDCRDDVFKISSRFKSELPNIENYIWDHAFTVGFIWNAVTLVWRGVWGLGDVYLFPDTPVLTAWVGFAVGSAVVLMCVPAEIFFNILYRRTKNTVCHVFLEEIFAVLVSIGTIHVWRGIWIAYDVHLLPDSYAISCWLTNLVGIATLFLIRSGSSVMGCGCLISGDVDPFYGCLMDVEYFQYFFPEAAGREKTTEESGTVQGVLDGQTVQSKEDMAVI